MHLGEHQVHNEPKINAFMVQDGKRKIQELFKARNSGEDVAERLNKLMQPVDEKIEYEAYEMKERKNRKWMAMAKDSNDAKIKEQLRLKFVKEKRERTIAATKRPERDLLEMADNSQHYQVHMDNQIHYLKQVLAQDKIHISERAIEVAFKMPKFDWRDVAENGKPVYNNRGAFLTINPFPRVKKAKGKGKKKKKK